MESQADHQHQRNSRGVGLHCVYVVFVNTELIKYENTSKLAPVYPMCGGRQIRYSATEGDGETDIVFL